MQMGCQLISQPPQSLAAAALNTFDTIGSFSLHAASSRNEMKKEWWRRKRKTKTSRRNVTGIGHTQPWVSVSGISFKICFTQRLSYRREIEEEIGDGIAIAIPLLTPISPLFPSFLSLFRHRFSIPSPRRLFASFRRSSFIILHRSPHPSFFSILSPSHPTSHFLSFISHTSPLATVNVFLHCVSRFCYHFAAEELSLSSIFERILARNCNNSRKKRQESTGSCLFKTEKVFSVSFGAGEKKEIYFIWCMAAVFYVFYQIYLPKVKVERQKIKFHRCRARQSTMSKLLANKILKRDLKERAAFVSTGEWCEKKWLRSISFERFKKLESSQDLVQLYLQHRLSATVLSTHRLSATVLTTLLPVQLH